VTYDLDADHLPGASLDIDPQLVAAARRTVARHAHRASDFLELAAMLGLGPDPDPPRKDPR
jgi:hypothetical protein